MITRKSNLSPHPSPARLALFAALLSGSAIAAAQDATTPGPVIEIPAPVESQQPVESVIAAPPLVETPVIVIPSTPPMAATQSAPIESVNPAPAPEAKPVPQPQNSVAKPIAKRAAPATAETSGTVAAAPAVDADTAILPDAVPVPVPDLSEPLAVSPYSDEMTEEPVENGNADENWLLAAAGLGLLGVAGGAAVAAGKRRRRRLNDRSMDERKFPAVAAAVAVPKSKAPVQSRWTGERVVAALNDSVDRADAAHLRSDPVFTTKVSGPPITDPLFSAKIDAPPIVDPLFIGRPDYVGPGANPLGSTSASEREWHKPHGNSRQPVTPAFAV